MAKAKVEEVAQATQEFESERMVVLSDGMEVRCVSVSPLLIQEVTMRHAGPDAPTKTITTGAGLDETYIDYDDAGYLRATEKAELGQRLASTDALLLMGLPDVSMPQKEIALEICEHCEVKWELVDQCEPRNKCEACGEPMPTIMVDDNAWAENLMALGIEVPDSGPRRMLAFIKFALLRRTTDLTRVVTALTDISGATEEMIAEAEDSFTSSSAEGR